jgi:hypothetical protein
MPISGLDVVIVLLIVAGTLNGLRIGAVRQLGNLLFFYISVILSTRFYHMLLPHAKRLLAGAPMIMVETFLFTIILVIVYALLGIALLGYALSRRPERQRRHRNWRDISFHGGESLAKTLNHLAGLAIGFLTISAWIGVGLLVYRFLLGSSWLDWDHYRRGLLRGYRSSVLVPVFKVFLPYVVDSIEPWFPGGLPSIFWLRR